MHKPVYLVGVISLLSLFAGEVQGAATYAPYLKCRQALGPANSGGHAFPEGDKEVPYILEDKTSPDGRVTMTLLYPDGVYTVAQPPAGAPGCETWTGDKQNRKRTLCFRRFRLQSEPNQWIHLVFDSTEGQSTKFSPVLPLKDEWVPYDGRPYRKTNYLVKAPAFQGKPHLDYLERDIQTIWNSEVQARLEKHLAMKIASLKDKLNERIENEVVAVKKEAAIKNYNYITEKEAQKVARERLKGLDRKYLELLNTCRPLGKESSVIQAALQKADADLAPSKVAAGEPAGDAKPAVVAK